MGSRRGLTAREIAGLVGGEVLGPEDVCLAGVAPLDRAGPGELAFLASARYLPYFQRTSAGAVLLATGFRSISGGPATRIVVADPHGALQRLLPEMYPEPPVRWGLDPTARVGAGVRWAGRIAVGPGAVLGSGVELGADCIVGPFAVIGAESKLGERCRLEEHVVLAPRTELGRGVVLRSGARVGGQGFGYVPAEPDGHRRIPHVGRCVLGDHVEVGANSTIDRGSVGDTVVGAGTKIDNLVHVGHNVRIGARCLIMAQVGIAGSVDVEDDVVLAGQAGLADHVRIGQGARVAAQSGVIGDVAAGSTVSGYPARNHRSVLRQSAALRRLAPLVDRLQQLASPDADGR
ncbi:MAG: UDP-3-O-(3-hydroxymyristoyl)glucosamine N-acyltransferase [Gemmatimonadetes bacterium]|nr:UDP-3-O-(3-hydroxymyristoyl)glucosamine N-acyltransferase [Gemmatimonadota bacterium]